MAIVAAEEVVLEVVIRLVLLLEGMVELRERVLENNEVEWCEEEDLMEEVERNKEVVVVVEDAIAEEEDEFVRLAVATAAAEVDDDDGC